MNVIVTEIDRKSGGEHKRHILFKIGRESSDYTAGISFGAFRNHERQWKPNMKNWQTLYMVQIKEQMSLFEIEDMDDSLEKVTLDSVWEFYKYIGYDYKTKKYSLKS